jgi:hypothetical protein
MHRQRSVAPTRDCRAPYWLIFRELGFREVRLLISSLLRKRVSLPLLTVF